MRAEKSNGKKRLYEIVICSCGIVLTIIAVAYFAISIYSVISLGLKDYFNIISNSGVEMNTHSLYFYVIKYWVFPLISLSFGILYVIFRNLWKSVLILSTLNLLLIIGNLIYNYILTSTINGRVISFVIPIIIFVCSILFYRKRDN